MGEEKKAEETKPEEKEEAKKPENQREDKKEEKKPEEESKDNTPPPPQPPPEIVLKVFMHCEGCARKVRRCLKGFPGVKEVITDCKSHKVVVRGEEADPQKVLERVQKKSHRQVELISPVPKPPTEEKKPEEKEKPAPEEKKEEAQIITVILKVHMHCEACAQEIKRRILKMMGVESAEADLKKSEVSVKGVFDPAKLVEFVLKRTRKQAVILKQEAVEKKADEGGAEEKEKKEEEGKGEEKEEGEKKGEGKAVAAAAKVVTEETKVVEMKSEYQYYPPRYVMEMYAYPPQIFSDENPNACAVM